MTDNNNNNNNNNILTPHTIRLLKLIQSTQLSAWMQLKAAHALQNVVTGETAALKERTIFRYSFLGLFTVTSFNSVTCGVLIWASFFINPNMVYPKRTRRRGRTGGAGHLARDHVEGPDGAWGDAHLGRRDGCGCRGCCC